LLAAIKVSLHNVNNLLTLDQGSGLIFLNASNSVLDPDGMVNEHHLLEELIARPMRLQVHCLDVFLELFNVLSAIFVKIFEFAFEVEAANSHEIHLLFFDQLQHWLLLH